MESGRVKVREPETVLQMAREMELEMALQMESGRVKVREVLQMVQVREVLQMVQVMGLELLSNLLCTQT
jgi:hypothetical protein